MPHALLMYGLHDLLDCVLVRLSPADTIKDRSIHTVWFQQECGMGAVSCHHYRGWYGPMLLCWLRVLPNFWLVLLSLSRTAGVSLL